MLIDIGAAGHRVPAFHDAIFMTFVFVYLHMHLSLFCFLRVDGEEKEDDWVQTAGSVSEVWTMGTVTVRCFARRSSQVVRLVIVARSARSVQVIHAR